MIGIVIAGHGSWPKAMVESLDLITGDQPFIKTVEVTNVESAESIKNKLNASLEELNECEGNVILLDLFGGSPSHAVVALENKNNVLAITGANLPILLELVMIRTNTQFDELSDTLLEIGKKGIRDIFKELQSLL